ncbi:MAG: MerR family transcriptional regulator [Thermotogota bacterium]
MEDRRKPSKEKASRHIPPDEDNMPKFIISVAAKMLQLHPQTLRQYEKRGYVTPFRLGNLRLYSERDIHTINRIKELADEGIPTNGIDRILALERRIEELERLLEAYEIEIVSLKNRIRKEVPPLPVKIEVKSFEFQFYGESSNEEDEDTR